MEAHEERRLESIGDIAKRVVAGLRWKPKGIEGPGLEAREMPARRKLEEMRRSKGAAELSVSDTASSRVRGERVPDVLQSSAWALP